MLGGGALSEVPRSERRMVSCAARSLASNNVPIPARRIIPVRVLLFMVCFFMVSYPFLGLFF
jgi:hypothetical protein